MQRRVGKMVQKVIYYDSFEDDFAGTNIKTKEVGPKYKFYSKNVFFCFITFIFYYFIAVPLVFLISKIYLGMRFKNRKELKKLKKSGYFLFANHTHPLDVFVAHMASFPKKTYIISNPDATSIKVLDKLVIMLGGIPLPSKLSIFKKFTKAITYRYNQKQVIGIYPEAHIWPYYNDVRPFKSTSFKYAIINDSPVIGMITIYRKRFLRKKPGMDVYFSKPFYPDKK